MDNRRDSDNFIYGLNPVFEVLRTNSREIRAAHINSAIKEQKRIAKLADILNREGVRIVWSDKGRLNNLTGAREHQGVALEVSPYPYTKFDDMLEYDRLILLDNIEDPQNTGAIIRSAEVLGFDGVLLPLKGAPAIYPSVVKASAGATEHMRVCRERNANAYVRKAIESGFTIVALDAKGNDDLDDPAIADAEKVLLVAGGENKSVGHLILELAHHVAAIPQAGKINSLNASVAAGIAMYILRKNSQ